MGVLNVTPDSFSDGGRFLEIGAAVEQALRMVEEGAAIVDIGGESTRPGAAEISGHEEIARVVPVIEAVASRISVPVSVDTTRPEVMRAAVGAGAAFINDVRALRRPGALEAARDCGVPVCLMHMQGEPGTMQHAPQYDDIVAEVREFLQQRIAACEAVGIPRERLVIDPGFGFGKTLEHNLALLRHLDIFRMIGLPVLAGMSRKSMIGALLGGAPVDARLYGSVAAAVIAAMNGAMLLRVHDVKATVDALAVVSGVLTENTE